ncbi:MAG: flagellar basal body L-ring protein FlgH [Roseiarcus sp.]|jgi:flagellar L-ring protein precursor FlgH
MRGAKQRVLLVALVASGLAGCGGGPAEFMREPGLSPVGSGLAAANARASEDAVASSLDPARGLHGVGQPINFYSDQRIAKVGDIVTVVIAINDKATFDNTTDRSKTANSKFDVDWGFSSGSSSAQPSTLTAGLTSTSTTQGQGNIDRQEQIQVSVAAVVTEVLPNGNLIISGSQEVRVNYELRQLTVAGIVRPSDISRANTIAYDHIAEARISYGGRGRLSEVQQPNWGQEIYDFVKPF